MPFDPNKLRLSRNLAAGLTEAEANELTPWKMENSKAVRNPDYNPRKRFELVQRAKQRRLKERQERMQGKGKNPKEE